MRPYQRVCTVLAAAFVCGLILVGRPVSAQTQIQAGQVIISEFRLRGPVPTNTPAPGNEQGQLDEFIELYNNTDSVISVQALDGSNGWSVVISNGQITGALFTIPNGTVIPARGHYLGANSDGYSLCNYPSGYGANDPTATAPSVAAAAAPCLLNGISGFPHTTPDQTWTLDVPDGSGVALFATTNGTNFTAATRLDAAGFTASPALYKEGNGIGTVVTSNVEHAYYRDLRSGLPRDTSDNAADFVLVGTSINIQVSRLGAPGPENRASPIVNNTTIVPTLLDPAVSSALPPNRVRSFTMEPNATFGTLLIRRTITNNTGQPVGRLRFRVVIITTAGSPSSECGGATCADLRALTSQGGEATSGGQPVIVLGLRLEEPPAQPAGGGYNSSLSADTVTLGSPLLNGQSINVEFKLGIERTGPFRFFLNVEAQNTDLPSTFGGLTNDVGAGGGTDSRKRKFIMESVGPAPAAPAAPASPAAAPAAAPRSTYAPPVIYLTLPAPERTRAAEGEEEKEGKEEGSGEAPPSAPPAPGASAAGSPAAAEPATEAAPASKRRAASKKLPAAAKARPGGNQ